MELQRYKPDIEKLGYSSNSADTIINTASNFLNKYYKGKQVLNKELYLIRKLKKIENLNTRRNIAKSLLVFQRVIDKKLYEKSLKSYKKIFDEAMLKRNQQKREPVNTEEFEKKKEELEDEFDSYVEDNDNDSIVFILPQMILLSLLTDYPPRRASDYRLLQIRPPSTKEGREESNYIDNKGKAHFNKYKNSNRGSVSLSGDQPITKFFEKSDKEIIIQLNDNTYQLVKLLRKAEPQRKYLLQHSNTNNEMTPSMLTKFVEKEFGLNFNEFRKMYIQKHINSKDVKKAQDIAKKMSHSLATQQRDYAERD